MPGISANTRIVLWVVAAICGGLSAVIGNVLAINIVYFFSRQGRPPTRRPARIWMLFFGSLSLSIVFGALAAFAPASFHEVDNTGVPATPEAHSTPFRLPDFPRPGDNWTRPTDGMVMVYVPEGAFMMGSDVAELDQANEECKQLYDTCDEDLYQDETPQHAVTLSGFWLDRTEVTHNQYMLCVANGACEVPNYASIMPFNLSDHPVVGVSWENARGYCAWAGTALPTEAQWEYAARGDAGLLYTWGNEFNGVVLNFCDLNCAEDHRANDFNDGYPETAPVDKYQPGASWSGALNMNGNVWEWVSDWYAAYSSSAQVDPKGPSSGIYKVVRGGSWINDPVGVRSANRSFPDPEERSTIVGFRCSIGSDSSPTP